MLRLFVAAPTVPGQYGLIKLQFNGIFSKAAYNTFHTIQLSKNFIAIQLTDEDGDVILEGSNDKHPDYLVNDALSEIYNLSEKSRTVGKVFV